jgi:hypothetical protein
MPLYLNFTTTSPDNVNPGRPVFENTIVLTNDNLMVLYASREESERLQEDPTTVAFIS